MVAPWIDDAAGKWWPLLAFESGLRTHILSPEGTSLLVGAARMFVSNPNAAVLFQAYTFAQGANSAQIVTSNGIAWAIGNQ